MTYRWARGGYCGHEVVDGYPSHVGFYELLFRQETANDPLAIWRGDQAVDYPYVEITLPGKQADGG